MISTMQVCVQERIDWSYNWYCILTNDPKRELLAAFHDKLSVYLENRDDY